MGWFNQDDYTFDIKPTKEQLEWKRREKERFGKGVNIGCQRYADGFTITESSCEDIVNAARESVKEICKDEIKNSLNEHLNAHIPKLFQKFATSIDNYINKIDKKHIDDLANYLLLNLKEIKIDSDTHPDYVSSKVNTIVDCLKFIDKEYGTDYTSKIKIDKITI